MLSFMRTVHLTVDGNNMSQHSSKSEALEDEYTDKSGMSPKCYMAGGSGWNYNDAYVQWLEAKITGELLPTCELCGSSEFVFVNTIRRVPSCHKFSCIQAVREKNNVSG